MFETMTLSHYLHGIFIVAKQVCNVPKHLYIDIFMDCIYLYGSCIKKNRPPRVISNVAWVVDC
jgi:hypothetical protein